MTLLDTSWCIVQLDLEYNQYYQDRVKNKEFEMQGQMSGHSLI